MLHPRESAAVLALALLSSFPALSQAQGASPQSTISKPTVSGTVVTWPAADQRQLVVIESPAGDQLRELFEVGEQAFLDLADLPVLPDGTYQYNHRLLPAEEGEFPVLRSGSLRVLGAVLQAPRHEVTRSPAELRHESQPLVESGAAPFLWLNDTSGNGTGTDDNWWLWADADGNEAFSIFWDPDHGPRTTWSEPFRIERHAKDNALYVDALTWFGGRWHNITEIGVNTNTPSATLHLVELAPDIKLEDIAGSTWQLQANGRRFYLGHPTGVPLAVDDDAPSHSLWIGDRGVGLGTANPQGNLHVFGQADEDVFSGIGPDLVNGPAFNFGYSGSSYGEGSGFFNARSAAGAVAPNPALYFMTNSIERMMIDRDGDIAVDMDNTFGNSFDPLHPIHAQQSGAYLSASGVWRDASSRSLKENIQPLAIETALAALTALEPVQFNYKADPEDALVGFIAEDVPDLVATPDRKTLAPTDIVGVLTKVVQEQQRVVQDQQRLVLEQQRELEDQGRELLLVRREIAELRSRVD